MNKCWYRPVVMVVNKKKNRLQGIKSISNSIDYGVYIINGNG